ncbi:MAG: SDR family NAD(P)-dependent oxidoreductase [Myxococcaceae bacterium]
MSSLELSQLLSLRGQVAIVTGGGKGIGRAIGQRLAEAGASVLVADNDVESAQSTAQQIRAAGGTAQAIAADTAKAKDAAHVVQGAVDAYGRLDLLVNNAGIFPMTPALELTEETWDKVLSVNLKGAFFFAQAAAKQLAKGGRGGRIVNIASIDALHPSGALAHYDASKGGMAMLTRSLAAEWAPHGIRVNTLSPGGVRTPGADAAMVRMGAGKVSAEEISKAFIARIPLKRMGEPDDIAKAVLFLASPMSDYVTGVNLVVDGGYLLS